ncbi:hypothetical protein CR155_01920 [Pollutimonas nitritireducens]|uniref:DUF1854 domain-containing protein n=1 Tax=Pollutimonas nitritireducens TaxID=2045209 RepID=A0A2N4ULF5_9BURK|nr:DUF1854 domain-containing protein [Pollutimonas nitritireducens]PLC55828.1 hypothetical protein CR155_01920 [Pollutimonas nitritireducens]
MTTPHFQLGRDPHGRLILQIDGRLHDTIVPVRSFPISAANEGIALVGPDGSELVWIDSMADLPADTRALLEDELSSREFMPEIKRIRHVSSFATPSRWQVETDRGVATLLLKAEEDIRRLSASTLLIADAHGVQYLIRDVPALDRISRRLLDHFL